MNTADQVSFNALRLPVGAERVVDADEEVFILYSNLNLQAELDSDKPRGLGHINSRQDLLNISLELKGGSIPAEVVQGGIARVPRRTNRKTKGHATHVIEDKTIEITLAQDTTALRSRKGDTGSVLWRASIDFAQLLLQQAHVKSPKSLFDFDKLKDQHILELGAGTGVLSLCLSTLCRRYTVTDIEDLIPLIRKNVTLNYFDKNSPNIQVEPLDWVLLHSTPISHRKNLFDPKNDPIDVLLIVDCIYNPSLVLPLVETIDYLTTPGRTCVIVVSELRSHQIIQEFLEIWLSKSDWSIYRLGGFDMLNGPYAVWVGWKNS